MRIRPAWVIACFLAVAAGALWAAQPAPQPLRLLSIQLTPGVSISVEGTAQPLDPAIALDLLAAYRLRIFPPLALEVSLGLDTASPSVSMGAGFGVSLPFRKSWDARAYLRGGYAYGLAGGSGTGPFFAAGLAVSYSLSQSWSVGVEAGYTGAQPQRARVSLGPRLTMNLERADPLRIRDLRFQELYAVLLDHYDGHPLGKLVLLNAGRYPIEDLALALRVERIGKGPVLSSLTSLAPGEQRTIELSSPLSTEILSIDRAGGAVKVPASLTLSYSSRGWKYRQDFSEALLIHPLGEADWSRPAALAALVNPRSEPVRRSAELARASVGEAGHPGIDANLLSTAGAYGMLAAKGMRRLEDRTSPFVVSYRSRSGSDTIAFPPEVLSRGYGDYDELALLLCSLLEAAEVPSALVATDSMVYPAFSAAARPGDIGEVFVHPEICVVQGDTAWIAVDVSDLARPFVESIQSAADALNRGSKEIFPIRASWQTFPPFSRETGEDTVRLPAESRLKERISGDLDAFVEWEVSSAERIIRQEAARLGESPFSINALGTVYARYGMYEKAETQFRLASMRMDYVPALANRGRLLILKGDFLRARPLYERAHRIAPNDAKILLALILCACADNDIDTAREYYALAGKADPGLARSASFLEGASATASAEKLAPFPSSGLGPATGLPPRVVSGIDAYNRGDLREARRLFVLAYEEEPFTAPVLAVLATVQFRLQNFGTAEMLYDKLRSIDPDMAGRFAFLAESPRLFTIEEITRRISLEWLVE